MSNKTNSDLLDDYREAIKLHIWFSESQYSFHQGKANKDASARWLNVAHKVLAEYAEKNKENKE
jgi:hypothetical protein